MVIEHFTLFVVSALLSVGLTVLVQRLVRTSGVGLATPRERDIHRQPIPRLGGVAVGLSFFLVALGAYIMRHSLLTFVPQTLIGFDLNFLGIIGGVTLLLVVGMVDDIRGLSPWVKLFFHFLAGVMLATSAVLVSHITNPFGGTIQLGWLTYPFVVLWVMGMINVINFLDGLDGLASGVSLIATIVLYLLAVKPEVNQLSMAVLAIILAGSLAGFLPFNFYPAKIFLGDSGSQVLGFLLAVFSIISGGKLATAILVLGVPILDVLWVIARRLVTKKPIYQADRFHIHHRLLQVGLTQKQAVLLLYTVSAAFGIIALQTQSYGKLIALVILLVIMVIGGSILVLLPRKRPLKGVL